MKKIIVLVLLFNQHLYAQCWKTVSTGDALSARETVAIKTDGTMWYWANSVYKMAGDTAFLIQFLPQPENPGVSWQSVWLKGGGEHLLAQKTDGTLWAWGKNTYGELGDGTTNFSYNPVEVGTDNDWQSVSLGEEFSVAVKSNGTLWAWGLNYYGELGDGTTVAKHVPTQIGAASDWQSVAAGVSHVLAIKTDGTLWAWGYNRFGMLGEGTQTDELAPVQIGTSTDWKFISASNFHSLAIKTDGTLWAWGMNIYGQIGDGTSIEKDSPVQIGTDVNWESVSAGLYYSLGLKKDSTIWSWGSNYGGELGLGSHTVPYAPTQIGTDADWISISAGNEYSVGLKRDSTLWQWGGSDNHNHVIDINLFPTPILCQGAPNSIAGLPLPIKLLSFNAQRQNSAVAINWQTEEEINSKVYRIERSSDGVLFSAIADVPSNNNPAGSRYRYTDASPLSGINYYRLKSIDIDGKYAYSNVKVVTFTSASTIISVYPNPVEDILFIDNNFQGKKISIQITELTGKKVLQIVTDTKPHIKISSGSLAAGIYLITISDGVNTTSKKIVKATSIK